MHKTHDPAPPRIDIPTWAAIPLSLFAVTHLFAVAVLGLGVPSGPWPGPEEATYTSAPAFTAELFLPCEQYLAALHLQEDGYLPTNRHRDIPVFLEARLLDREGKEVGRLRLPDPAAPPTVRAWQQQLANHIGIDFPMAPPEGNERMPADQRQIEHATRWRQAGEKEPNRLETVPRHLLNRPPAPRDFGPSEWTLATVRSLSDYLLRSTGVASVEIVRSHYPVAVPPDWLFETAKPDDQFFVPRQSIFGVRHNQTPEGAKQ